eukprot:2420826-Rhodomonas_salina.2
MESPPPAKITTPRNAHCLALSRAFSVWGKAPGRPSEVPPRSPRVPGFRVSRYPGTPRAALSLSGPRRFQASHRVIGISLAAGPLSSIDSE